MFPTVPYTAALPPSPARSPSRTRLRPRCHGSAPPARRGAPPGEGENSLVKYFRHAETLPGGVLASDLLSWGLRLRAPEWLAALPRGASGQSAGESRLAAAGSGALAPRYQRPGGTSAGSPASRFPFPAAGAEGLGLGAALRSSIPRSAMPMGGELTLAGPGRRVPLASCSAPLHRPSRKQEQGTTPVAKALLSSCCLPLRPACAPEPPGTGRGCLPRGHRGVPHPARAPASCSERAESTLYFFSITTFLPSAPARGEPVCVCTRRGYRQLESLFPGRLPGESLPGGAGAGGRYPGRQRPECGVPPEPCGAGKCGLGRSRRGPPASAGLCRDRGVLPPPRGARTRFSELHLLHFRVIFSVIRNLLLGDCFPFPLVCLLLAS